MTAHNQVGNKRRRLQTSIDAALTRWKYPLLGTGVSSNRICDLNNDARDGVKERGNLGAPLLENVCEQAVVFDKLRSVENLQAFTIICNWNIVSFEKLEGVADLRGVFLYCLPELTEVALLHLLKRTPLITALTIIGCGKISSRCVEFPYQ